MTRSSAPGMLIALAVLLAALLLAFTVGRYPAGLGDLFHVIAAKLAGRPSGVPPAAVDVMSAGTCETKPSPMDRIV